MARSRFATRAEVARRILGVFDNDTGKGWGFVIKGDISEKFYCELADAAQVKLDFVST